MIQKIPVVKEAFSANQKYSLFELCFTLIVACVKTRCFNVFSAVYFKCWVLTLGVSVLPMSGVEC